MERGAGTGMEERKGEGEAEEEEEEAEEEEEEEEDRVPTMFQVPSKRERERGSTRINCSRKMH